LDAAGIVCGAAAATNALNQPACLTSTYGIGLETSSHLIHYNNAASAAAAGVAAPTNAQSLRACLTSMALVLQTSLHLLHTASIMVLLMLMLMLLMLQRTTTQRC
jgi:hypothetical protein